MCEDPVVLLKTCNYEGSEAFTSVPLKSTVFREVTSCSAVDVSLRFRVPFCLLLLVSCFTYSLTLKVEEVRPSETSVDFYMTLHPRR
jgi:hypothetical protein